MQVRVGLIFALSLQSYPEQGIVNAEATTEERGTAHGLGTLVYDCGYPGRYMAPDVIEKVKAAIEKKRAAAVAKKTAVQGAGCGPGNKITEELDNAQLPDE